MRQCALISVVILFCLKISVLNAQVPTLDPAQTVNTATGEMGFNLPLGVVKGINGHDFPVNLSYKAGIKVSDEASPAGLGFGYGAGSVYRKVNFVPDECKGGKKADGVTPRYKTTPQDPDPCTTPWWALVLQVGTVIVGVILMCIPGGQGPGYAILGIAMIIVNVGLGITNAVLFKPNQFIAGGTHLPGYTPLNEWDAGKGILCGGNADIPDVYFVNCPYLSGQLTLTSDAAGHRFFTLRQTNGSSKYDNQTVKVNYDKDLEKFSFTLQDGTRLLFEQGHYVKYYNLTLWQFKPDRTSECSTVNEEALNDSLPDQWMLTKVLFPDFLDKDGDNDPTTNPEMNSGSWIVFKYDVAVQNGVSQLPFSSAAAPYTSAVSHSNGYLMDVYLDSIKTPNQYAKFFYRDNRLDALWFKTADFANWPGSVGNYRNSTPVATLLRAKTGTQVVMPVKRNVLDSIVFYSAKEEKVSKVVLRTDYTLRPKTFNSFSKDESGAFRLPEPGDATNTLGASLTLKSLVVSGADGKEFPQVSFEYVQENPEAWDYNLIDAPGGCKGDDDCEHKRMAFYIEKRDLYAYYSQNTTSSNNLNERGAASKAQQFNAWSLQKVNFSTGSSISWMYEPHRYDRANNVSVKGELQSGVYLPVFYGGGIRVRKITLEDGRTNKNTWNYFYTDNGYTDLATSPHSESNFVSSGHVSVEPFPYRLAEDDDKRNLKSRGGFYTACQVYYEKVQVAKDFDETNWRAPQGYSEYEFLTSKDHPNGGIYGESDSSWMRGLQASAKVYNGGAKLISESSIDYLFEPMGWVNSATKDVLNPIFECEAQNSYGWVRVRRTDEVVQGVNKSVHHKYGMDISGASQDKIQMTSRITGKIEPWMFDLPPQYHWGTPDAGGAYTMTRSFGGTGLDHVMALQYFNNYANAPFVQIFIASDMSETEPSAVAWVEATLVPLNILASYRLMGISVWNYDNNNTNPEMMLFFTGVLPTNNKKVWCVFLKDFTYNGADGRWNYTSGGEATFNFSSLPSNRQIVSCAIGRMTTGSQSNPDIVFLEGDINNTGASIQRHVYYMQDLPFASNGSYDVYNEGTGACSHCIKAGGGIYCTGNRIWLNNAQASNGSSVEITGLQDLSAYVYHARVNNFTATMPDVTTLENYCNVGSLNTSESSPDLRYYGMNRFVENDVEKQYLFLFQPVKTIKYDERYGYSRRAYLTIAVEGKRNFTVDIDGQPNETWATAPAVGFNTKYLVTKTNPAYWKYPGMQSAHMLTQNCQTTVYEKNVDHASDPITNADARSSQATTWSPYLGSSAWVPNHSYAWNNQKGAYSDFVFPNPPADPSSQNPSWQYTGSVEKYNTSSTPIEVKNGKKISSATVYRNDLNIPIGTIANSRYAECAVFTCDYDMNVNSLWFDEPNGWKHYNNETKPSGAVCELASATPPHFGEKCLHVTNCQAAAKNITVHSPTAKINWSTWVYPLDDKPIRFAASLVENGVGNRNVFYDYVYNTSNGLQKNKWQFVKFTIDISKPVGGTLPPTFNGLPDDQGKEDGIYVWVGNHEYEPASDFYIEDIRIYPAKSLVTTTYYDSKWQQPILTVDANGNPSQKVEYDEFGRAVRWYKVDKNDPSKNVLLQQKEYHMMGDFYAPNPNKWYKIVPAANENYCIHIKDAEWSNSKEIHLFTYTGTLNQLWKFVPRADGYYNIVSKGGSGVNFGIDDPFGNPNNGTLLGIWPICDIEDPDCDDVNQQWKLTDAGDGFCRIVAHASPTARISFIGGIPVDRRPIVIQDLGINTKWKLIEVNDEVRIKNATMDFYIGKTEVTQADYMTIMGNDKNPSQFPSNVKNPVESVTWYDAILYCNKRSKMEGLDTVYIHDGTPGYDGTGKNCIALPGLDPSVTDFSNKYGYRLPTEEEWKAAYYYGTPYTTDLFWGSVIDPATVSKYAWFTGNSNTSTQAVGQKEPNKAGLFDIAGNVTEWVWYTDPVDVNGSHCYGGAHVDNYGNLRGNHPGDMNKLPPPLLRSTVGFRVVRTYR